MLARLLDALARPGPGGMRARDWSVFLTETRRTSLGTKDRETGNVYAPLAVAEAAGARYLIVWEDGRVSRGALERRHLETDVDEALATATASAFEDPDAAYVLGPRPFPEVPLSSEDAARAASGDMDLFAERLSTVRRRVAEGGCKTWSGSFQAAASSSRLVTSAGLDAAGSGTSIGWHVTLDGELGAGHGARAPERAEEFDARLTRLLDLVRRLREPSEPPAAPSPRVIVHPDVVEELFLQTLLHNLDGSTVAHGEGAFRREQFGASQPVLREDLHLRLDPLEPLGSGSYRFSSEGVPAARCAFVEGGRLVTPILDLKYARRLELPPTPIPYSMDALHLEGPELLPFSEAVSRAAGGALVLSVLGTHTQDPSSGDFSLSVPQALRIGPKGLEGRVRRTIAGNVFEILRSETTKLVAFEGEHTPGLFW
jgi:PmbA protein